MQATAPCLDPDDIDVEVLSAQLQMLTSQVHAQGQLLQHASDLYARRRRW